MVAVSQVMVILRPWLGPGLSAAAEPLMEEIARRLNAHSSPRPLWALTDEMDSLLFRAVHEITRGSMLAQLEDGTWVRIRVGDFSVMADELLFPLFLDFPVDGAHLALLRDYSMKRDSLSALRALYTRFAPLQTPQELATIASVARSCYPPFRWRGWLGET